MKDVWQLKAVIPKKTLLQMWLQVVFKCHFADDAGIMLGKVWSTYEKWPADDQTVAYKQECSALEKKNAAYFTMPNVHSEETDWARCCLKKWNTIYGSVKENPKWMPC